MICTVVLVWLGEGVGTRLGKSQMFVYRSFAFSRSLQFDELLRSALG